ncbi:MAG: hydrocarbon-binding protein [Pelatocladus maniniholoensis HA4357-MV3]|jgi:predicted hydrocarbon binding protein|uniref:Hydrocarbon-binding protein n=1 Tax=Pelatocladus maniniholoensis HA4357-MV3 TaxID=1117104 RepID=A0A9E3H9X7_9NOST|nr:hydrocarbon-binding protein [Pelatocladus maniniholoensis HA4357-MV3]BAZ68544.1 hypothetical protein NIES4106_33080 [Fischerella sp. NIES-4106]
MLRPILGDFSSIVCFKAAIIGMEEALGEKATAIALTAAGRYRGKTLAQELNLANSSMSLEQLADKLDYVFGKDGTRLCIVEKIVQEDNEIIKVYTSETLCSADEPQDSKRKCTYTLGAIWGVLEIALNHRLQGKHTESVLRGGKYDVFEFNKLS